MLLSRDLEWSSKWNLGQLELFRRLEIASVIYLRPSDKDSPSTRFVPSRSINLRPLVASLMTSLQI